MIPALSEALAERGFDTLTDVQLAVTAPDLAGADLLVSAQTGSGKTVGFGLAIAPTLLGEAGSLDAPAAPLALIVAPTRELAMQVSRELGWLYAKAGARVATCIGGMDARTERRALERGAHIVVGTPGRLRDHITRGALNLSDVRAIVLDEADEMLDLGFREDLEFMLGEAPEDRRTLLFSATVPPSIVELAQRYQRDAVRVATVVKGSQHADIAYQAIQVAAQDAEHAIINLLRFHDAPTAIVFANTRAAVARLTARFANRGLVVVSLSGELSQDERSHALQALRDGRARVCVATDVAARGIDLPNLDLVIHADLPTNTEGLLHRSGRTGRAGRKGISALIVPDPIVRKAQRLLKWARIEAEWTTAPSPDDIYAKDRERLLADPAWDAESDPDEAAFAAELLALHGPEKVAAACLRLYRGRLSAAEELNLPADPAEARAPRPAFGPSFWLSLSTGREAGADPRWLLPMLLRTFNIEKTEIGKIRVRDAETYVELAEAVGPTVRDRLARDGALENGLTATLLDGVPAAVAGAGTGAGPRGPRSFERRPEGRPEGRDGPRPDRPRRAPVRAEPTPAEPVAFDPQPAPAAALPDPAPVTAAAPTIVPAAEGAPAPARTWTPRSDEDNRKPRHKAGGKPGAGDGRSAGKPGGRFAGKPAGRYGARDGARDTRSDDRPAKPYGKRPPRPAGSDARPWRAEGEAGEGARKPRARTGDRPFPRDGEKPAGKRPDRKSDAPRGKPWAKEGSRDGEGDRAKPWAKDRTKDRPRDGAKPGGYAGKPRSGGEGGKPRGPKPAAPSPFRAGAADPSKPLDRAGRAPRKAPTRGGDKPPRRKG